MKATRLLAWLAALCAAVLATPARSSTAPDAVLGSALRAALAAAGRARVVVALREPEISARALERRVAAVGSLQDAVLMGLETRDFQLSHRWASISALAGEITAEGAAKLARDPDVLRVDLDVSGSAGWLGESVDRIRADDLHNSGLTGRGVLVAVLDSGADTDHPDLKDAIVDQQCFCTGCCPNGGNTQSGPGAAEDDQGHGTNVTGIIAGRGRAAKRGVAPEAGIVAIKVLDRSGGFSSTTQVISGFDYVINSRPDVKVVNMSLGTAILFGGPCDSDQAFTIAFAQAINALKARGTLTVASSLNMGSASQIGAPACIQNAIAVGAVYDGNVGTVSFGCVDSTTAADRVACFSNSNAVVDLLAPGGAITAAGMGGGTSTFLGTSQAAPHVAGAAALMLQANPGLTPDAIEAALKNTGIPITDPKNGLSFKRIDVRAALGR
jgi:subtilisin family serine protease